MFFDSKIVPPPLYTTHPTDTSAAAPFSGVFTCTARGYGNVSIEWKKENGDLPIKSDVTQIISPQIANSTLVIPNVTISDVGRYYCIASSGKTRAHSNYATLFFAGTININIAYVY